MTDGKFGWNEIIYSCTDALESVILYVILRRVKNYETNLHSRIRISIYSVRENSVLLLIYCGYH